MARSKSEGLGVKKDDIPALKKYVLSTLGVRPTMKKQSVLALHGAILYVLVNFAKSAFSTVHREMLIHIYNSKHI